MPPTVSVRNSAGAFNTGTTAATAGVTAVDGVTVAAAA